MSPDRDMLAYCGAWCPNCLGYTGVISDAADEFWTVLDRHQFDKTVRGVFPNELRDWDRFREMLSFLTGLRCDGTRCRQAPPDPSGCPVRRCCRERGYHACFECPELDECDKLRNLYGGLHYAAEIKHLRAIREMGLEPWLDHGPRYVYWHDGPLPDVHQPHGETNED